MINSENTQPNCDICYKIICRECGWEAGEQDVLKIQQKELTSCPVCGWKPKGY